MGVLLVMLACLLWAFDTLIRYPLLSEISSLQVVFFEHLFLMLLFFIPLFRLREVFWKAQLSHLFYFFIVGGLGSAYATLAFTQAFALVNPSVVILLQKLQPLIAVLLARILLHESINKKFLIWAALCVFGGLLVSFEDIFGSINDWDQPLLVLSVQALRGYGLALLAVFGWGASTVYGKKLGMIGYRPREIMTGRFTCGFLCMLPLVTFTPFSYAMPPVTYGKILLMVILAGLLGMYAYYEGLKRLSARVCAIAELFFPFCAVLVNWFVLGKGLTPIQLLGGLLLLLGSTVLQWKRY